MLDLLAAAPYQPEAPAPDRASENGALARLGACVVCGNRELYKKKDFPHGLGLAILAAACLAFLALNHFYHQWLAWTVLIASAVFDGLLYLWVGDAAVCYRCGAQYRGFAGIADCKPFELGIAERYRQERLRRAQVQTQNKPR